MLLYKSFLCCLCYILIPNKRKYPFLSMRKNGIPVELSVFCFFAFLRCFFASCFMKSSGYSPILLAADANMEYVSRLTKS